MIRFLHTHELVRFPVLARTMFQDRARQFRDRLGWRVSVDVQGRERDEYDDCNPLYVIWQNPDGSHGGSLRLLPTTGRVMVNEVFSDLLPDGPIRDGQIWECTRFCLAPRAGGAVAAALMQAGGEVMRHCGVDRFVGVFDAPMVRVYSRIGSRPRILGQSGRGRAAIGVGLWHYSEATRAALEARSGINAEHMTSWFQASVLSGENDNAVA